MVSQTLLENVHRRLQDIKNCHGDNSWFGNTSVLAVGDFHQLPPVRGQVLYRMYNLTNIFMSLFYQWPLIDIMRQKDDIEFAHFLNRLRIRDRSQAIAAADINILTQAQLQPHMDTSDILHVFGRNVDVQAHNLSMLNTLPGTPVVIQAVDIVSSKGQKKQHIPPYVTTNMRNRPVLADTVTIKTNARVMLTANIDVADGLANGVLGTVAPIPQCSERNPPPYIIIRFDQPTVGATSRSKSRHEDYADCVVLTPHKESFNFNNITVDRTQYPITLSWAVTIHKVQGQSLPSIVISMQHIFTHGMAYVALSRVTNISGLHITHPNPDKIYTNPQIEQAISQLPSADTLPLWTSMLPPISMTGSSLIKIASLNAECLPAHIQHITNHYFLQTMDVILVQETWLETSSFTAPNRSVFAQARSACYSGTTELTAALQSTQRGGVAILFNPATHITPIDTRAVDAEIQAITFEFHGALITTVNCYRPPDLPLQHFCQELEKLVQLIDLTKPCLIAGDFNVDLKSDNHQHRLTNLMLKYGFQQTISQATTKANTLIDHLYTNNTATFTSAVCPLSFGHHHATAISFM